MLPRNMLGRSGFEVSLLGFGAEALGRRGRSFDDAARALSTVLDLGVNLIDTASCYGNSEAFIGRALADRHRLGEFVLVTKCGWNNDWQPRWKPQEIAATIEQSLVNLNVETLDVLLVHSCELELLKRGEVITAVQKARDQGKARSIGYSGDNAALRFAIESGAFEIIECSFSMLDQANAPMIEMASQRNMGVLIKRPIANAVPGATHKPRSDYAAQYWPRWQAIGLQPADVGDVPWLEVAMRFSGFWPGVSAVLVGSSNADHMSANAQWLEHGPLPDRVNRRLRDAFTDVDGDWPALG